MNKDGFTLIEFMIVIVIISVIVSLGVPAFNDLKLKQIINGQANQLYSLIYLARSEAIKRSNVITVCKSSNRVTCSGEWSDGWLMFVDKDADGALDGTDQKITAGVVDDKITIDWTAFGSNNYIRLTPRGMTLSQNGTFTICPVTGNEDLARTAVVSKLARVRLPEVGIDVDGNSLSCD